MIARAVPLRRAARAGSTVASACVAMLSAANDSPHKSRATISASTPDSSA